MSEIHTNHCTACLSSDTNFYLNIKDHSISGEDFIINECNNCGFRFTSNPPEEIACGKYYQSENYISHSDTKTGLISKVYHWVRNVMLGRKYHLLQSLDANRNLLDVGSGTGYFPDFMQKKGYNVIGIEVDDTARNYSISKFGLNVLSPNQLKNKELKSTFGFITLWHVLEHLYNPDEYMSLFSELLDANGYLIIAVPNHQSHDAKTYKDFWAAYDVPRHLWHFSPKSLEVFAERNGFKLIKKELMPFDPFYNSLLSEKYKAGILQFISGLFTGLIALIKGYLNVDHASSIIYILQKKA